MAVKEIFRISRTIFDEVESNRKMWFSRRHYLPCMHNFQSLKLEFSNDMLTLHDHPVLS